MYTNVGLIPICLYMVQLAAQDVTNQTNMVIPYIKTEPFVNNDTTWHLKNQCPIFLSYRYI